MDRQPLLKNLLKLRMMRAKLQRSIHDLDDVIEAIEDELFQDGGDTIYGFEFEQ
jgi:hypothetical protein